MPPPQPWSTPAPTSSDQEGRHNDSLKDTIIILMIGSFIALLQVRFPNEDPFGTKFAITVTFVVTLLIYGLALYAKKKIEERFPDFAEIINSYGRLFGFLSIVMLLLLLVPCLGWIILGVWACFLIKVTYQSHEKITAFFRWVADKIGVLFHGSNEDDSQV